MGCRGLAVEIAAGPAVDFRGHGRGACRGTVVFHDMPWSLLLIAVEIVVEIALKIDGDCRGPCHGSHAVVCHGKYPWPPRHAVAAPGVPMGARGMPVIRRGPPWHAVGITVVLLWALPWHDTKHSM